MLNDKELVKFIKKSAKNTLTMITTKTGWVISDDCSLFKVTPDLKKSYKELESLFPEKMETGGVVGKDACTLTSTAEYSVLGYYRKAYEKYSFQYYQYRPIKTKLLEDALGEDGKKKIFNRLFIDRENIIRLDEKYASILPSDEIYAGSDSGIALFYGDLLAYVCKMRHTTEIYDNALKSAFYTKEMA